MSQNNTFESIVLCLLFFIIGGAVTCHLMKNRYPAPTAVVENKTDNYQLAEISMRMKSLEKTFSDKVNLEEKIKKLESQNSEILASLSELKSLKQELKAVAVTPPPQPQIITTPAPTVNIDYSRISNMVNSQSQFQNSKIADLTGKVASLETKLKEAVSNSWVNDQKLNEIKDLLSKKTNLQPLPQVAPNAPQQESPQLVKKYVDSGESKPVARSLSIRSDLPPDYQAPKKVYKVDELK